MVDLPLRSKRYGAEEGTRTPTGYTPTATSKLRVYQFHHLGTKLCTFLYIIVAGNFVKRNEVFTRLLILIKILCYDEVQPLIRRCIKLRKGG